MVFCGKYGWLYNVLGADDGGTANCEGDKGDAGDDKLVVALIVLTGGAGAG